MSDDDKKTDDAEASEEQEVKHALGTGAREAVDGDLTKAYVTDDVSPSATALVEEKVDEDEKAADDDAEASSAPSSPAH